jgi:hypothetical protein
MSPLRHEIVERASLVHGGFSGASLERATLAGGQRVVLKRMSREEDWLMRASNDNGRLPALWAAGIFERVPAVIEHALIGIEADGDGWLLVMRDHSKALFPEEQILSRDESRRILAAAAALHEAFSGESVGGACSLADRYASLSPAAVGTAEPSFVIPARVRPGWEAFAEIVPRDVAEEVFAILEHPHLLAAPLGRCKGTLIQGDLKIANLGFLPGRVVMLDWGSWTGVAPPAVEFAWYLAVNWSRVAASREEIIEDFRIASGERWDEAALPLALLGGLVQLGWNKALDATRHPDEAVRNRETADLAWWVARARECLEMWPAT